MNISEVFAEKLKAYRKKQNLTQEELFEESDVAVNTIRSYEQGKGNPTLNTIALLANALGVTIGQLCGEDEPKKNLKIETYADLICVLSQLSDLDLAPGIFCNGTSASSGTVSIECNNEVSFPHDGDICEEYIVKITFEDKTLYDFFSTYKKMLEMIDSESDPLGKETLQSMKNAWLETQMRNKKDDWLILPF